MKYICDKCGHSVELNHHCNTENCIDRVCPICEGLLIAETELKRREEIQENINNEPTENEDAEVSPQEEAEEVIAEFLMVKLAEVNDINTWNWIEEIEEAQTRGLYRRIYIEIGGVVPEGAPITI